MSEENNKPQSNTPDFNEKELEILKFWKDQSIFEKSLEQTKDGQPFVFYDGHLLPLAFLIMVIF